MRITGTGTGGRNREVALAALPNLSEECLVSSVASDGIDNGPRAGAIADVLTAAGARKERLDPAAYLRNNDSHAFFESAGSALITGPTGSNVADLIFALKA